MIELNDTNFETQVLDTQGVVVVDFWAPWCGPCKMLGPILEELEQQYSSRVKFCKVNVDSTQALAVKYKISSIPTLLFFKNGQLKEIIVGLKSKGELEKVINRLINEE